MLFIALVKVPLGRSFATTTSLLDSTSLRQLQQATPGEMNSVATMSSSRCSPASGTELGALGTATAAFKSRDLSRFNLTQGTLGVPYPRF
jgi:hypothetical protein